MPGDATLTVVAELKDLFSKEFQKVTKTVEKTNKQLTQTNKTAGAMGVQFKRLSHTLFSLRHVFGTVIGGIVVKQLITAGAKAEDLERAFGNLNKSIGVDAKEALQALRKATRNTVSDMDLMQNANQAILLGVVENVDQFEELANAGRILGKAVGRTATQGFQDLATGIGRQSRLILDNLGLVISSEAAYKKYAEAIGKTVEMLTDAERKKAFRLAAFESIRDKVKDLGDDVFSTSEKIGKLTASWTNLQNEFSKGFAKPFADYLMWVMDSWAGFLAHMRASKGIQKGVSAEATGFFGINTEFLGLPVKLGYGTEKFAKPTQPREENKTWKRAVNEVFPGTFPDVPSPPGKKPVDLGEETVVGKRPKGMVFAPKDWEEYTSAYLSRLEEIRDVYRDHNEWFARTGTEADKFWGGMTEGVLAYREVVGTTFDMVAEATYETLDSMRNVLSDVFFDAIMDDLKTFKEYMRSFLKDLARIIADFMAKKFVAGLIGAVLGSAASGALAGALGPDLLPEPTYAQYGGIATRPMIAGEAGPEKVTPWGRTVTEGGGGGGFGNVNVNFTIQAMDGPSVKRVLHLERRYIQNLIADALSVDPNFKAAIRSA